ncbi:Per1-domain-containing protein [Neoconidiobolus thromboides FSU 785]|nr:Per1-domain-containing protein [Neoconidiobolus thromboides FSU 785]
MLPTKFINLLFSSLLVSIYLASRGDNQPKFINCLTKCKVDECDSNGNSKTPLPLQLQLTFWNCEDECKYQCMQKSYSIMLQNDQVEQFYGKWPFYRVFGIQEIASFVFSILNGYQHFKGLMRLKNEISFFSPYKIIYMIYACISLNTWVWSTIFHARDKIFTEKMDYFSAYLSIIYTLYMTSMRVFRVNYVSHPKYFITWSLVCLVIYARHVAYLSGKFDYDYNMLANIVTGGINNLLWFFWSTFNQLFHQPKHPNRWAPSIVCFLISLAMSMELFDFPAVFGLFDAHSIWHFSTIFLIPRWYDFFVNDIKYLHLNLLDNRISAKEI